MPRNDNDTLIEVFSTKLEFMTQEVTSMKSAIEKLTDSLQNNYVSKDVFLSEINLLNSNNSNSIEKAESAHKRLDSLYKLLAGILAGIIVAAISFSYFS